MEETLHYIIRFLFGEDIPEEVINTVGYTSNRDLYPQYSLIVIPSGFFEESIYGTPSSLPNLPLAEIEGIPLLFGNNKIEQDGHTLIVHADLIASTYFLITRYEETIKRSLRDQHGRFPGKESLPYRAGFIHRPLVDEYRKLIRRWLKHSYPRIPDIKEQIRKVYLTHDVDAPFLYRSWKGMIRSLRDRQDLWKSLKGKFGPEENDPYYTFPWLFRQDNQLKHSLGEERCQTILFIKGGGNTCQDKPVYNLGSGDIRRLVKNALTHHIDIGLHSSYQSGLRPTQIPAEKKNLETHTGQTVRLNRHHFLASREPEDMNQLETAGFTDDFTIGYADVAGFRLGTCHPVRWINPVTRKLSSLRLHPLTIMDCSLDEPQYMGLGYKEARDYCINLIDQTRHVGGDLVLLWHNTSFENESKSYHRELYCYLLKELARQ